MGSKQIYQENLDPPPLPNISKENLGLWIGWTYRSDRELVREAASKGNVSLAIEFLSRRKNQNNDEVKEFIKKEVLVWVDELLSRKLIFRVSNILQNIGLDPLCELQCVFYKTTDRNLRDYIGNHLRKLDALPVKYEQLQTLLDIIIANSVLTYPSIRKDSLEELDQQSSLWKEEISAKLFLNTCDSRLIPLLKPESLWQQLLVSNKIAILKSWIQVAYSSEYAENLNIPEDFMIILKSFPITENMINFLENSNIPKESYEILLTDFVKYGVFIKSEKSDLISILSRLNNANSLANIYNVLGQNSSNLPIHKFVSMLVNYCLENNLLTVLNACTKNFDLSTLSDRRQSKHLDLMIDFRNLVLEFDENQLCNNIFNVSTYLSEGNLIPYFCDNPLIFLSLLMFTKDVSIEKAMSENVLILYGDNVFEALSNTFKQFKLLGNLYFKKINGVRCRLTYLDLVEKHSHVDVKKAYSFYFEKTPLPSFSAPELQKFAYSKKLNYIFYLKQCRPSIASKRFFLDILTNNRKITEQDKASAKQKVYKIAIKNFENTPLVVSCVSFLEMMEVDSEFLRISTKAANILLQSGFQYDDIVSLFLDIDNNASTIQTMLDKEVVHQINGEMMVTGNYFIQAAKEYDIVFKFSMLHGLPLPQNFLSLLAQHNYWFPFLLYAEMKNYPIQQIKEICANFKNPNLLEHVVHSVMHDIQVNETNILMRERDSRKYLLSKLGVRRSVEGVAGSSGSLRSKSTVSGSLDSSEGSQTSEILEIDISNTKATLLQTLIRCHNSTDPPRALLQACQLYRNPLLAILATSYEPDSIITNWITWLAVATDLYEVFTNFESLSTSGQLVTDLLNNCMKNKFPRTLLQSVQIFIPFHCLADFLCCLCKLINKDYDIQFLSQKLENFKNSNSKIHRRISVISQTDREMTYLKNLIWIENTALQLLCSALIFNTESYSEQLDFIETLCKINISQYFRCETPNFSNILKILTVLFKTDVRLNLADYLDPEKAKDCIQICINNLLKLELFDEALKVAQYTNIETDQIVLKKWQNKFEHRQSSIQEFLLECDQDFVNNKVSPTYAISFFKERVSVNDIERYYLLKFSHKWAESFDLSYRYNLEKKKILAFLKISDKLPNLNELTEETNQDGHMSYKEMIDVLETINSSQEIFNDDTLEKLNSIIVDCLDKNNFWLALKVEKIFGCSSNDLNILKLCHGLAEGLVMSYQLNEEQQQLIAKVKEIQKLNYKRRSLSYRGVSVSVDKNILEVIEENENEDAFDSVAQDTLGLIHSLIEKLTHGSDLAYSVFMKYRISCNIEVPYDILICTTDHIKLLKDALQDDCSNKLEVVHDFLEVFRWTKDEITDFFCEQFVEATSKYSKSKTEHFTLWDVKVNDQFHLILKLLKDECSTLGYKFLNYATAVHKGQVTADLNFKISEMAVVVELLIAAHNCFTTDCNMEGISTILKKCRTVISHLLTVRSWKLIVRLFTGVGRYTELNFVFNILKENHQFEFLLSRGSKRDDKLKLACVEYLKKYCPEDKELYKLVALHFNLYAEIAAIWEREARGFINNLVEIAKLEMKNNGLNPDTQPYILLTKCDGTTLLLNKMLENYVRATEFYVQGRKFNKGMNSAKQAELIALEKSLLKNVGQNETVPNLLNLQNSKQTIDYLISKELNFYQSNILTQAYNHQPEWAQVLYDQAIVHNNISYFDQYVENIGLSEQLVESISKKFLSHKIRTEHGYFNMRHIISKVSSLYVRYRLASELGFTSLVSDIIAEEQVCYLKDTVYKKGYKS